MKDPGSYGPLHAGAPDHRKVYEVAGDLGIEEYAAFGLMAAGWARSLVATPDGSLPGKARQLARLCGWHGDPEVLGRSFVNRKLVDVDETGGWHWHDHEHYAGKSLRERALKTARMGRWRGGKEQDGETSPEAPTETSHETPTETERETSRQPLLSSSLGSDPSGSVEVTQRVEPITEARVAAGDFDQHSKPWLAENKPFGLCLIGVHCSAWGLNPKQHSVDGKQFTQARKQLFLVEKRQPSDVVKAIRGMREDDWPERVNRNGWPNLVQHFEKWVGMCPAPVDTTAPAPRGAFQEHHDDHDAAAAHFARRARTPPPDGAGG